LSDRIFGFWHRARDGTPEWECMRGSILRLRPTVRRALEDGTVCRCAATAGTCAEILRVKEGLWNFVWFPGVEPTNNAAERALRHAVIWRRISGGTDSKAGSRFEERMLTVVATCRQQGLKVLDYLSSCFQAARNGQAIPPSCRSLKRKSKPPDSSYAALWPATGNQARLSTDYGRTWSDPIEVSGDGIGSDLGYPSTAELDDGTLISVWYEVMKGSPRAVLRQAKWKLG
jgi:hypothetical protein